MNVESFIAESNRIEGILRPPTEPEMQEFVRFVLLDRVTIEDLEAFMKVYQPDAVLRDRIGLDVRVGEHIPPRGAPYIRDVLQNLLDSANRRDESSWRIHTRYETLHPFTDGNGRSGRMLWAWQVGYEYALALGFLHRWYYLSLQNARV